jgi:hypothetical protein
MADPLGRAERNREEAAKFSDLARSASSPFLRGYYSRLAERYLLLEENGDRREDKKLRLKATRLLHHRARRDAHRGHEVGAAAKLRRFGRPADVPILFASDLFLEDCMGGLPSRDATCTFFCRV